MKTLYTALSISILSFISSVNASVIQELEVRPGLIKSVPLPFEYATLPDDRSNVKIVIERFYTVLEDKVFTTKGDEGEETVVRVPGTTIAFVGPLQPCILVALRNNRAGRAIVFHKHFSSNLENLVALAITELALEDPTDLSGVLFTNKMSETIYRTSGMLNFHKGLSQRDEVLRVKNALVKGFEITDRTQIQVQLFQTTLADWALGDYESAELGTVVNSKLNIRSLCAMHENLYNIDGLENYALTERYQLSTHVSQQHTMHLTRERLLGKMSAGDDLKYDHVPFERLS